MSSPSIGIMQGRLSPKIDNKIQAFPYKYWKKEFEIAAEHGFDSIEWIVDEYANPMMEKSGIAEIERTLKEFDVGVNSVCCDFFMNNLLFRVSKEIQDENLSVLKNLIENAHALGIKILEIPLVDSSSMKNKEEETELVQNLEKITQYAKDSDVSIGLETDYPPEKIIELLKDMKNQNVVLNYDTGNSAALGFDVKKELGMLGKYIKNIHVKDRELHGDTVLFGRGNADYDLFFSALKNIDYRGDLVIQGARIEDKTPTDTCLFYKDFIKRYIERYF